MKILVVEDEELIRTMVKMNLIREGYRVSTAVTGEEMLALVDRESFHLILLDIVLPGISGVEALKRMRSGGNTTPVVMVSVVRDVDTKVSSLNSGADDYIPKPFDRKELIARVNAVIRRRYRYNPKRRHCHGISNNKDEKGERKRDIAGSGKRKPGNP